jgi:CRISPR-associated endonuclease Cas1
LNPLYVDFSVCTIRLEDFSLVITNKKTAQEIRFRPREIPYDSIFIQQIGGYVSFASLLWLNIHNVSLVLVDQRGNSLGQFDFSEPLISNELRIAQVHAFDNRELHLTIARRIVETKLERQKEFLEGLSLNFPSIQIPEIETISKKWSEDFIRNNEARFAQRYFSEFAKACNESGYEFRGRNVSQSNMHAPDVTNALMNYAYTILKSYVRRSITAVGLDNSIPFLHDLRRNEGLVYDIMELWRSNCDYSVLQTMQEMKGRKKD